jgi:hypothetical protein
LGAAINYTFPWGLSGTFFVGLVFDTHGHFGTYAGGGAGGGVGAGASSGVQAGYSNGNSICAYGGPFANYSGTFGAEAAGTVDYFEGEGDAPGGRVRGGDSLWEWAAVAAHQLWLRVRIFIPLLAIDV